MENCLKAKNNLYQVKGKNLDKGKKLHHQGGKGKEDLL